ncbi:Cyclic nucleotide binding domain [Trypanosoma vivax]|uniref:Putative cyclic nucleotide-binding protein n=1 Tax=Trypanosoma vivax (strain Y486) TaxID=1055687 RepID=G0U9E2_TRYVY|nr:putative cyclic nucleotide-binding protein [Trypanosoma vivax]KAH8605105.1 Cyclic nucleotide binding domain [Trypanosoma vivax]CCC54227.1 putative cyclic nucleotide-binding protein [Trypanosoma vivax Y486]
MQPSPQKTVLDEHDWLITRTESFPVEDVLKDTQPVYPFVCPPLPPMYCPSRRYTQVMRATASHGNFSEWEKKAILCRLKNHEPVSEEEFSARLMHVHDRNTLEHIEEVRSRAARIATGDLQRQLSEHQRMSSKREVAFARYRNLRNILRDEVQLCRTKRWYTIVLSHVFLRVLLKERRVHEAFEKIVWLLVPILKRRVAVRKKHAEAAALTRRNITNIPRPTPSVINSMQGTFFTGWPSRLLEQLTEKAKPLYLKAGHYLMHEGDMDRCMYMITAGTVTVILLDKRKGKRRTKENSKAHFSLSPPCYVGEFALVCKEARTASIVCETDVAAWSVSPEAYDEVAQYLSTEVASKQKEATDVRRRANLKKFSPLRVDFLMQFPFFEKFSTAALNKICETVEPIVLHNKDHLFSARDMDPSAYFIQDGTAILVDENGDRHAVPRGSCVGVFECFCGVNERKRSTIISQNYCDIWRMSRDALLEVGMSEPAAFLCSRNAAREHRALEVKKPPVVPDTLRKDPYLQFCLTRQLMSRMWEISRATIYLNDEKLVIQGQPFHHFIILHRGVFEMTLFSAKGEQVVLQATIGNSGECSAGTSPARPRDSQELQHDKFVSHALGAYEYCALLTHYSATVISRGVSEAFVVELSQFNSLVPNDLKRIIETDKRARDYVQCCHRERNPSILNENVNHSYVAHYRRNREGVFKTNM